MNDNGAIRRKRIQCDKIPPNPPLSMRGTLSDPPLSNGGTLSYPPFVKGGQWGFLNPADIIRSNAHWNSAP